MTTFCFVDSIDEYHEALITLNANTVAIIQKYI